MQRLHQARRAEFGDVGSFPSARESRMNAALLQTCGDHAWTKLFTLSLDGRVVAGLSGFEFRGQLFGHTFSMSPDERWRKLRVGDVLLGMIVRWGIERGLTLLDLSRGNEPYKRRFGGIPSTNYRAVACASSWAALMGHTIERVRRGLYHSPWL